MPSPIQIPHQRVPKSVAAAPRTDPCADTTPTCPACGGIPCLCRPRFFPGQLLTDEELNRTMRYVVEKNKLHNRYLVGWGVACGLEVVCDACDPTAVVVRSGYALSPCGEDIALCEDQKVPICSLIDACRETVDPCDPYSRSMPQKCPDEEQQWVLAVCYDERPSRGVTALTGAGDTPCQPGCSCGGSSQCGCKGAGTRSPGGNGSGNNSSSTRASGGCGCGGGGKSAGTASTQATASRKPYQPNCEPTQICEGFRFVAYRLPQPASAFDVEQMQATGTSSEMLWAWMYANRAKFGPLLERLLCCVIQAMELRASWREDKPIDTADALKTYESYARALWEFAADFSQHRCSFVLAARRQYDAAVDYVASFRKARAVWNAEHEVQVGSHLSELDNTWLSVVSECFCSALLPACPAPVTSNCVPLAVVTIQRGNCRVVEICNWQQRKLLISWPTISYWLSWLPWGNVRNWIAKICCSDQRSRLSYYILQLAFGAVSGGMTGGRPKPARIRPLEKPVEHASDARETTPQLDVAPAADSPAAPIPSAAEAIPDIVARAMQANRLLPHLLNDFDQLRTAPEVDAPAWATIAAHLVDGSIVNPLAAVMGAGAGPVDLKDLQTKLGVGALQNEIGNLKRTVALQSAAIEELRKGK